MSKLSDNLKTLRMMSGLSVRQVAQRIERSASSLSNWENERQLPDTDSLEKLCHLYRITPNELLGWEKCRAIEDFKRSQAENIQKRDKLLEQRKLLDAQIKEVEKEISSPNVPERSVYTYDPQTGRGSYITNKELEERKKAHLDLKQQIITEYKRQIKRSKEDKS